MSADLLRRAAALMRERAEAASWQSHRWETGPDEMRGAASMIIHPYDSDSAVAFTSSDEAPHIASWHPVVALAVADWLDTAGADLWAHGPLCECGSGCHECDDSLWQPHVRRALALARAYLGESA